MVVSHQVGADKTPAYLPRNVYDTAMGSCCQYVYVVFIYCCYQHPTAVIGAHVAVVSSPTPVGSTPTAVGSTPTVGSIVHLLLVVGIPTVAPVLSLHLLLLSGHLLLFTSCNQPYCAPACRHLRHCPLPSFAVVVFVSVIHIIRQQ